MLASFEARQSGVVVLDATVACDRIWLAVRRTDAPQEGPPSLWMTREPSIGAPEPVVVVVEPGHYAFIGGGCAPSQPRDPSDRTLKSAGLPFEGVDIGAGEAVYLGTLHAAPVHVEARALLTGTVSYSYQTYELWDRGAEVRERVRARYPTVAANLVTRFPTATVAREDVAAAIEAAYAPDAEGVLPKFPEATARLERQLADLEACAAPAASEQARP
jgi:hypothetical protein